MHSTTSVRACSRYPLLTYDRSSSTRATATVSETTSHNENWSIRLPDTRMNRGATVSQAYAVGVDCSPWKRWPSPEIRPRGSTPRHFRARPLFWAAFAAFVGTAVGLSGTLSLVAWAAPLHTPLDPYPALASWAGSSGGLLVTLSLFGVPSLLGRRSWSTRIGSAALLLWLAAYAFFVLQAWLGMPGRSASEGPPPIFFVLAYASPLLGTVAMLLFALDALFLARKRRLGVVLLLLSVPGLYLSMAYYTLTGQEYPPTTALLALFSSPFLVGASVGVEEAALWALLGAALYRGARERAHDSTERLEAEENRKKALRHYEEGLRRNDPSAVEELVAQEFRALRRGARGRLAMERLVAEM